jgi:hypothetical protein
VFAIAILAAIALIAALGQPTTSKVKAAVVAPTTCTQIVRGHTQAGDNPTCADDGLIIFQSGDHSSGNWNGDLCPICGAPLIYGHTIPGN